VKATEFETYERGWGRCERCGCRRPLRELGKELQEHRLIFVCLDRDWCQRIREDLARRAENVARGQECLGAQDCPEPRESGGRTCARHRPPPEE